MTRKIPVLPTLLVLIAVAVMIALGFWQLRRMHEKELLLADYATAGRTSVEVPWPTDSRVDERVLYRHSRVLCGKVVARSSIPGHNAQGQSGMAQVVDCALADGTVARVVLGWSLEPVAGQGWQGGLVRGVLAPGPRLVADPPLAGLQANAVPDASGVPNNHLAYAVQWFFFAATALVIYALALRKRASPRDPD